MRLRSVGLMPYKMGSKSVKNLKLALKNSLSLKVLKLSNESQTYIPRPTKAIINWGTSRDTRWDVNRNRAIFNKVPNIRIASNKLLTFEKLSAAGMSEYMPLWTTSREQAENWKNEGKTLLCRTSLGGHSGRGIHVSLGETPLVPAPLYVVYKKKKHEYRVHVAFGKVIDTQIKRKRKDYVGEPNYTVRNHHTGWVYCRENLVPDGRRDKLAIDCVGYLGLDFGACDLIYNEREDKYYILEVNTAPGLEGTTVNKYSDAFVEKLKEYMT